MDSIYKWIQQNPPTNLPIFVAAVGVMSALLAGFFTVIVYPSLKEAVAALWYWTRGRVSKKIFEESYLDRLVDRHRFLPILPTTLVPVTESHVQEMDNIYVELGISTEPGANPQNLAEILSRSRRILILGDPGAGKTTILQFLALQLARARRNKPEKNSAIDRKWLKELRSKIIRDFQVSHCPLPIPVFLNRLRTAPDWPSTKSIVDAVHDEMQANDMLRDTPSGFFNQYIKRGECVFLFDAFDELGTSSAREAVAQRIGELASTSGEGNIFVVTSRIVGYSGELAKYGFETFVVQRLSWELITQLVGKWYVALKDRKLTGSLLETLKSNQRIAELAVNPMLLSLIVLVQYVRRVIPERRHVLYEECLKILVERRYAPPAVQAEYSQVLPGEEALKIIRDMAYTMHLEHSREVDRRRIEAEIIPSI